MFSGKNHPKFCHLTNLLGFAPIAGINTVHVAYGSDACVVAFGPDYTFEQMRSDAAAKWMLDPARVELQSGTPHATT